MVIVSAYLLELGCKVQHLALAWLAANPNTSTVILGASKPDQVIDNLKALDVIPKLTPAILEKIEKILDNKPSPYVRRLPALLLPAAQQLNGLVFVPQSSYGRPALDTFGRIDPMFA